MVNLVLATSLKQLKIIEDLATIIWNEHYTPIIGKAQVGYMLSKYQAVNAMSNQIVDSYLYYIINYNNTAVGYLAYKIEKSDLFLSKIYLQQEFRGIKIGKQAMAFVSEQAKISDCKTITLTVNKNNTKSIQAYEKIGFLKVEELVIDIGNGFVMDDYKMIKTLD